MNKILSRLGVLLLMTFMLSSCTENTNITSNTNIVICIKTESYQGCTGSQVFPVEGSSNVSNGRTVGRSIRGFGPGGIHGEGNQFQVHVRQWGNSTIVECAFIVDGNSLGERTYSCGDNVPSILVRVELDE